VGLGSGVAVGSLGTTEAAGVRWLVTVGGGLALLEVLVWPKPHAAASMDKIDRETAKYANLSRTNHHSPATHGEVDDLEL